MGNGEFFTLDRNNYFKGKQLTVRDFQDEQSYYINKQRVLNYALLGSGIVTGLDVVAVDNMRLTVESGIAVDEAGREIVVTMPVVKAVNIIEGFDEVDDKQDVYLCIEYDEKPIEPAYSVTKQEETLFNRIRESYKLYLTNRKPANLTPGLSAMLQTMQELFSLEGISVRLSAPRYVNSEEKLEITVEIEKCNIAVPVDISFDIEVKGFEAAGSDENKIRYYNAADTYHKSVQKLYFIPERSKCSGRIAVKDESLKVFIDGKSFEAVSQAAFSVEIIEESLCERLINDYMHRDIDSIVNSNVVEPIYLARLRLMKTKNSGFIEKLDRLPFNQYVMSNGLMYLLNSISKDKKNESKNEEHVSVKESVAEKAAGRMSEKRVASCGVENISIDKDNRGKVYYSSEIIHNLGPGEVSYELGFEVPLASNENTIVFGEENLFAKGPYDTDCPQIKYSIISYNDKGTFRIAVSLLDKLNAGNLKVHWYATKHGGDFDRGLMKMDDITISILPKLVNIGPREKIKLDCVITGCDDMNCIWKVEDEQGGSIDSNGTYIAPSKAGVYEVTAASVKYPTKKTSNYIVVSTVGNK